MKLTYCFFSLIFMLLMCDYLSLAPETGNPLDHPPVISVMADTTVKINDAVTLHAEASDPNGTVKSFEWALSGSDDWHSTGKGEYALQWGISDTGVRIIHVRAVDNEGVKSSVDSVTVTVNLCAPLLNRVADMTVKQHDTASFTLSASDTNAGGIVKKYYYKTGPGGWIDSSTTGDSFRMVNPDGGSVKIVWGAQDNDGVLVTDSFTLLFNRIPALPSMATPLNGAEAVWASSDASTGSITFAFSASDPDGEALTYTLFLGKDTANLVKVYQGQGTSFTASSLDTTATYHWRLTATDPAGQTASATGMFLTGKIDPIPEDGLVAYYPFNGNAKDESGNGNDGVVAGEVSLTKDRFGVSGRAYAFNGSRSYIRADAGSLPARERTVSLWFSAVSVANKPVFLAYGGGACGTSWFMSYGSYVVNSGYYISSHCGVNTLSSKAIEPPGTVWHHLVASTCTLGTRIYLDDSLIASNSSFITNTLVSGRDLSIGVDVNSSGKAPYTDANVGYFNGSIDDIRIYDRALSEQEIHMLFIEGESDGSSLDSPALTVWGIDSSRIAAQWNGVPGAVSYTLESADDEAGPFSQCYQGSGIAFIHRDLTADRQKWYRVKAADAQRVSAWSTVMEATANYTAGYWRANCITNGGFETRGSGWIFFVNPDSGAAGTVSYPDTGAKEGTRFCRITVTGVASNAEQNNWHVQLQDPVWKSVIGREYDLSFRAKADSNSRTIQVAVQGDGSDKYAYREGETVNLSNDWRQFHYRYVSDVGGVDALSFFFYCGYETGVYDFDDVVVKELTLP